jgi:hypothetical protein
VRFDGMLISTKAAVVLAKETMPAAFSMLFSVSTVPGL